MFQNKCIHVQYIQNLVYSNTIKKSKTFFVSGINKFCVAIVKLTYTFELKRFCTIVLYQNVINQINTNK